MSGRGQAISARRSRTIASTTWSGIGCAAVNRMVPLDSEEPSSSEATASTTGGLNGWADRWFLLDVNPISGLPPDRKAAMP
ncbi:hypothetical protein DVS28_a0237 [Euzebya pacifica]|uniref:Uncharacterized protein n=1 Tax=Euzebya pacifica TaxID=1608957 RepID=A0A346XRU8_9ACTN|nr:hypothetical protein DVS28_a0237 [Euzebya pacifica]